MGHADSDRDVEPSPGGLLLLIAAALTAGPVGTLETLGLIGAPQVVAGIVAYA